MERDAVWTGSQLAQKTAILNAHTCSLEVQIHKAKKRTKRKTPNPPVNLLVMSAVLWVTEDTSSVSHL